MLRAYPKTFLLEVSSRACHAGLDPLRGISLAEGTSAVEPIYYVSRFARLSVGDLSLLTLVEMTHWVLG